MSKRLKVAIDIDGVLIDTSSEAFLDFYEKEMGWQVNREIFAKTHSLVEATKGNPVQTLTDGFEQFLDRVEDAQRPIRGAHDALREISLIADIFLVTARAGSVLQSITEEFLCSHLPDVHYLEISMGNLENKAARLIEFGADYFIDDSFKEITKILQHQAVTATLIPFPAFHGNPDWNKITDKRIHWLSVWEEITDKVPTEKQPEIHKKAWEEIRQLIAEPAVTKSYAAHT